MIPSSAAAVENFQLNTLAFGNSSSARGRCPIMGCKWWNFPLDHAGGSAALNSTVWQLLWLLEQVRQHFGNTAGMAGVTETWGRERWGGKGGDGKVGEARVGGEGGEGKDNS